MILPAFAAAVSLGLGLGIGCGSPMYSRSLPDGGTVGTGGSVVEPPDGATASGGAGEETGGTSGNGGVGSGGVIGSGGRGTGGTSPTGGAPVTGGRGGVGSGGQATGGQGTAGRGTGGQATGGQATGGRGTGGQGTGGQGTGGQATGGQATGGQATGGQATGGQGTGGQGTGGQGTGGQGTGGGPPTRLIVSVDFVGGRPPAATVMMTDAETAGARPAAHWNSAVGAMGTLPNLILSDGSTSAATIAWNAPLSAANLGLWTIGYTDAPGDVRMMNGYLDPTWATIPAASSTILTVSGLPAAIASGTYDVYVYTFGYVTTDMRSYQYGVGATFQTVAQDANPPIPPASPYPYASANDSGVGTHVVFPRVTGASVSVTAKPVSGTNLRYRAPINGIQIVWPSGS